MGNRDQLIREVEKSFTVVHKKVKRTNVAIMVLGIEFDDDWKAGGVQFKCNIPREVLKFALRRILENMDNEEREKML